MFILAQQCIWDVERMIDTTWIDRTEYPFESNYLELDMGSMHYIDEGIGSPIVMVHGNPTWSFLYRSMIKGLSKGRRCIAMDHIGFGLSDKPYEWSYLPQDHAKNLHSLIDNLNLKDLTLVVQDWGGPIGLSYALERPENVKTLIIMNTWMWSVHDDPHYVRFSNFMGGSVGRFLIRHMNFFVKFVMKKATADLTKLSKPVHDHYVQPLKRPNDRKGCWIMPGQITHASDWLDELWSKREIIRNKPALLLWGMKDIAFREKELDRWKDLFPENEEFRFENVGHFVQEEKRGELCPIIEDFLARHS